MVHIRKRQQLLQIRIQRHLLSERLADAFETINGTKVAPKLEVKEQILKASDNSFSAGVENENL